MYVFKLNSNQQKWIENNLKNYHKNMSYKAKNIFMMITLEDGTTSYTMAGNDVLTQAITSKVVGGKMIWRKLSREDSKNLSILLNSPTIRPLPDDIFDSTKQFIIEANRLTSAVD